jgi:predicted transcriptional regulator
MVRLLVENGLLQYGEGTHTYKTTEKDIRFLQMQNKIDEVAPIIYISENTSKAEIKLS